MTKCRRTSCILSKFYIKPQLYLTSFWCPWVVSYRNSTSNHNKQLLINGVVIVVSYRNSTSNHNRGKITHIRVLVVSYRNSTSNHNLSASYSTTSALYLIEILHQTTTKSTTSFWIFQLYLIEILHQTTTFGWVDSRVLGLYLIEILHQTTTERMYTLSSA